MREKSGLAKAARWIAVVVLAGVAWRSGGTQDAKAVYPKMAPVEQYLIEDRNAEIALAKSAAPESISRDATVLVLGRHGYETAVQGKKRLCMPGGALLDCRNRLLGVLES